MTTEQRMAYFDEIVTTTRRLQRSYKRVYPYMVQAHLPIPYSEAQIRRHMADLARCGDLIRVGGPKARRGYNAPLIRHH